MYVSLALAGGILGLLMTGAIVYTVWRTLDAAKTEAKEVTWALQRWTVMDAAALIVFVIGAMLLFTDLLAVIRDRNSYPYYHYGYLLSAFVFMLVGMLVTVIRLAVVLRPHSTSANQHPEPAQTDESEEGVKGG